VCVVLCEDIDECDMFNNLCVNGECDNVMGYFQCSCAPGYKLDSTGGNCTGMLSVCWLALLDSSVYVCLSANFGHCKRLQRLEDRLQPGIAYLQIAYDHTVDVHNIFPSEFCGCH